MWNLKYKTHTQRNSLINIENKLVVARGRGLEVGRLGKRGEGD